MRRFKIISVMIVLFGFGLPGVANATGQAPVASDALATRPAKPAGTAPPTAGADAVLDTTSIDLLVHDHKGRSVTDLKSNELAITDNGHAVTVTNLRLVDGAQPADRLVAFVFGRLDSAATKNARVVALRILKMLPNGQFSFAVFGVDGRLRLFAPYSTDRDAAANAIETLTTARAADWQSAAAAQEKSLMAVAQAGTNTAIGIVNSKEQARARMIYTSLQQSARLVEDRHCSAEIAGLTALGQAQRQTPGRKAILYFAQSSQTDVNSLDQMRAAAAAANDAGTSIFPIDMNALDPQASEEMQASMAMGSFSGTNGANHVAVLKETVNVPGSFHSTLGPLGTERITDTMTSFQTESTEPQSALSELAARTGGRSIGFRDSLKKPVQQLMNDLNSYYEASYASDIEIYDGSFRPVTVKALRKGIAVRTPPGYLALPRGEETTTPTLDVSLVKVFKSASAPKEIDFQAAVLEFGAASEGLVREIAVEVPIANVDVREDPNTDLFALHVAIATRIVAADAGKAGGKVVQEFSEDIRRHGGLNAVDQVKAGFISFQRHVALPAGDYVLQAAVVDSNSEKAGYVEQKFHVGAAPENAGLSDVVLVRRTEAPVASDLGGDPMRYDSGEVIANLSGVLEEGSKEVGVYFRTRPEVAEQVSVSIAKEGKDFGKWPLHSVGAAPAGPEAGAVYLSNLKTDGLPPGEYTVTVSAGNEAAKTVRHVSFVKAETGVKPENSPADASMQAAADAVAALTGAKPAVPTPLAMGSGVLDTQKMALLETARKRALNYSEKLPNFLCVEIIDRSVDHGGKGRWMHRDEIAELLRYRDNAESRVVLEVNGRRSHVEHYDIKGPQSNGEFGGLLKAIFEPGAEAEFGWQGEEHTGGATVQVFRYKITQKNSSFSLTDTSNWNLDVAFHGLLSIEPETGAVRSVTLQADDLPAKFSIHASTIHVDYDYIAINNHDYLLPVRGEVSLQQGKHEAVLNALQFRDYKRFASQSRILSFTPTDSSN